MRFIDITTKYRITKDKITFAIALILVCALSGTSIWGVSLMLEAMSEDEIKARELQASALVEQITETTTTEETEITTSELLSAYVQSSSINSDLPLSSLSESSSLLTEANAEATTTTEIPFSSTTITETTIGLTEQYGVVYTTGVTNLRSGPGTSYSIVRELSVGSVIDIIGITSNGWYKTINGNYVLSSLTTTTPPETTTMAPPPPPPPPQTTTAAQSGPAIEGMTFYGSCTITFYGPQPRGDGTYSTTTATGTTCSQGRTCAADWGVFPSGTTIYVENDPLGGDGYYTVEDRGPGVNGSHIDIYADDPYAFSTTSRNVYIVN